jgi:hypothetical protein
MSRPKKAKNKGLWQYQVGVKPNIVTAYERDDKKNVVTLRWWPAGATQYKTKSLGIYLRDERGNIIPDRRTDAEEQTKAAYTNLVAGFPPGAPAPGSAPMNPQLTLTLQTGFDLAFAKESGMFDDHAALHYKEMVRYKDRVIEALGAHRTWDSIVPSDYETLWRRMTKRYLEEGLGGKTATLRCLVILKQTAAWLAGNRHTPKGSAEPDPKWEERFEKSWADMTGERRGPKKPRHTPEEMGRLLMAAMAGKGDPRLCLLFLLAAEARLGQAVRGMRSWLDLGEVGARSLGTFWVPDFGKKTGVIIDLTPETRGYVDAAMTTGYLRDLETAHRAGKLADYPLFPGLRLVGGFARLDAKKPLGKRAMTDIWHEFERLAGVPVVALRGWYGIRRAGTNLARDVEKDNTILNNITGHKSTKTREGYQELRRPEDAVRQSAALHNARGLALAAAGAEPGDEGAQSAPVAPSAPSTWELNRAAKLDRRVAKHAADAKRKAEEEMQKRIAAGLPVSV